MQSNKIAATTMSAIFQTSSPAIVPGVVTFPAVVFVGFADVGFADVGFDDVGFDDVGFDDVGFDDDAAVDDGDDVGLNGTNVPDDAADVSEGVVPGTNIDPVATSCGGSGPEAL